jgi:HD-like signal output (HDOD) protein
MPPDVKSLQIDRTVFQQTLEKKLADLPPLPTVVTKIMETVNDPNTSAEDLNKLISLDQGLSSKMLRIVNSAYYGFPKRISTLTHAVVILGFNTVRNLVLGVSAFGMLAPKGPSAGLNRGLFWEHAVATAVAASVIAKKRKPKTRQVIEEAFLVGLLHDFGKLFLDCYFPVQYAVTLAFAQRQGVSVSQAEQTVLAIDHAFVGKKIGEHWNFPPSIVAALASHHVPLESSEFFESMAIVHAADYYAWLSGHPSLEKGAQPEMDPRVQEWLGFTAEDEQWVLTEIGSQFGAAKEMLQMADAA